MTHIFKNAIVRPPAANFAEGLTTVNLGVPLFARALEQHDAYCRALTDCGLTLVRLGPDENYPDSTFVEDTAVLTSHGAVLTRPGAASRSGEVAAIARALGQHFPVLHSIQDPGTLDAGDVCEAGNHFFIGISQRTNPEGARQLAEVLNTFGYSSNLIDIRGLRSILHLKSGLAYLGDDRLVVIQELENRVEFQSYKRELVSCGDEYAANCVRVNDRVLLAAGYPELEARLRGLGYQTISLEMSEFQKMDGGLSCLSLRW